MNVVKDVRDMRRGDRVYYRDEVNIGRRACKREEDYTGESVYER